MCYAYANGATCFCCLVVRFIFGAYLGFESIFRRGLHLEELGLFPGIDTIASTPETPKNLWLWFWSWLDLCSGFLLFFSSYFVFLGSEVRMTYCHVCNPLLPVCGPLPRMREPMSHATHWQLCANHYQGCMALFGKNTNLGHFSLF